MLTLFAPLCTQHKHVIKFNREVLTVMVKLPAEPEAMSRVRRHAACWLAVLVSPHRF
jgi:hypothetical protein